MPHVTLTLDTRQADVLRTVADDHHTTQADYVTGILVECEIIPPPEPTTEELVEIAVLAAEGVRTPRLDEVRALLIAEDRLRSELLAISTGISAIRRPWGAQEAQDARDDETDTEDTTGDAESPGTRYVDQHGTGVTVFVDESDTEDEPDDDPWAWLREMAEGDDSPRRKPGGPRILDYSDAKKIRAAAARGAPRRVLAEMFGCSVDNIRKIVNGQSWRPEVYERQQGATT